MRINTPVSQHAYELGDNATLMSTTDPHSHVTYANAAFLQESGFERAEIIGSPHNLVRHPDMPPQAFADMWATLKDGRSWTALVKNRRKNGDHYWVRASATPMRRNGQVVCYMSVRTEPSRDEVAAATSLYAALREGRAGGLAFHKGLIVRTGLMAWTSLLQRMSAGAQLVDAAGDSMEEILGQVRCVTAVSCQDPRRRKLRAPCARHGWVTIGPPSDGCRRDARPVIATASRPPLPRSRTTWIPSNMPSP